MEMQCPIHSVVIPGMSDSVELKGLIVIVGPNSSGKTQLLHDINEVVMGRKRQLVVVSSIKFNAAPDYAEYVALLVKNGAMVEKSKDVYRKHSFQYGAEEGGGEFATFQANQAYSHYRSNIAGKELPGTIPQQGFLELFGPFTCSALFLKNRLTLMDSCENFDARANSPSKTLQSLHLNACAKEKLLNEIASTFMRGVWIDALGHHNHLVVRVGDNPDIPPAEDRLEPERMEKYRGIETEGDGIRSYAAICSALLLERRPLCLIDEPEMCLHPPQAYAIGRFIGKHVTEHTCTIIATHSSHVLRGILGCDPKALVIRVSRKGSKFAARVLKPDALNEATSKPRSRSEAILEGLFAQGVILCEAEGDRIVYESTYRTLQNRKLDIRFIPSEGTGGFADPLRLYTALGVPSAVIGDLDFLGKETELRNVLTAFGTERTKVDELCSDARISMQRIRAAAGRLDANAILDELKSMCGVPIDPNKGGTEALRGKLKKLVDKMYQLDQLKEVGVAAIPEEWSTGPTNTKIPLRQEVNTLLAKLAAHGLFLVPVGELESWLPVLMNGIGRGDKSRWAMNAAEKIEDVGARSGDVWAFVSTVFQFLSDHPS